MAEKAGQSEDGHGYRDEYRDEDADNAADTAFRETPDIATITTDAAQIERASRQTISLLLILGGLARVCSYCFACEAHALHTFNRRSALGADYTTPRSLGFTVFITLGALGALGAPGRPVMRAEAKQARSPLRRPIFPS